MSKKEEIVERLLKADKINMKEAIILLKEDIDLKIKLFDLNSNDIKRPISI